MGFLLSRLGLDGSQFQQALNTARTQAKAFAGSVSNEVGSSWKGLGAGFAGGIAGMFTFEGISASLSNFLGRAKELRELRQQLEMGADDTQKWEKSVDDLGLSFGGLQSVLMAIQQKRVEALTDIHAAEPFDWLGISRQDVLDLEGVNASDFARKVMMAAKQSEQNKLYFSQAFGRRGLKYLPAAEMQPQKTAPIDAEALEAAHRAELAQKKVGNVVGRMWSNTVLFVDNLWQTVFGGKNYQDIVKSEREAADALHNFKPGKKAESGVAGSSWSDIPDKLESLKAEKDLEFRYREEDAAAREREAMRQLMPAGAARQSLRGELGRLQGRLAETLARKMPQTIMTEMEQKEWDTARKEQASGIRSQMLGIIGQLRQAPVPFEADQMAKAGLFSSAALNFNPMQAIAQEQLTQLETVNTNLGNIQSALARDPYAP